MTVPTPEQTPTPEPQATPTPTPDPTPTGRTEADMWKAFDNLQEQINATPDKIVEALREATSKPAPTPQQQPGTPAPQQTPATPEGSGGGKGWFGYGSFENFMFGKKS